MRWNLALIAFALIASAQPASAQFVGTLAFTPSGCEQTGLCKLVYDFGFIDSNGVGWQASAGDVTDGASIPDWARPFIGQPFDAPFIRAAVIHDHYCDRHVRTWRDTHRVLYEGLVAGGTPSLKAKVMYYAVLIGGPKWISLIKGEPCSVGQICVRDALAPTQIPDTTIVAGESGERFAVRAARYDRPDMAAELDAVQQFLQAKGDQVTLDDLIARAKERNPDDMFFKLGDAIRFEDSSSKFPAK